MNEASPAALPPLALVVDDDATMRLLTREALEQDGLRVIEAEDGLAGLAAFSSARPDIVLLDVQMPEKDGFATCMDLRDLPDGRHVPVLMMTGLDDVESIDRAYQSGATDFITKPINWPILAHRARYMLRASRSFEDLAKLSRIQTVLSGINSALMRIHDRAKLFHEVCNIAVEHGKFRLAWIGLVEPGTLYAGPEAWAGHNDGYLEEVGRAVRQLPDGEGAGKLALQSGKPVVVNHIDSDPRVLYRNEALSRGYGSLVILPLVVAGETAGLIALYAAERGFFTEGEMKLLMELAGNVSFALDYLSKEEELDYLAYYDTLTALPNRTLFRQSLVKALERARERDWIVSLLFLDLDRFKNVNETLGHSVGDELLRQFGHRLVSCTRVRDTVGRLGADEFGLILITPDGRDGAGIVTGKIKDELRRPFELNGREVTLTASVGIATYPADASDADSMIKNAETAMYRAKDAGRDTHRFYTAEMNARALDRLDTENALRKALDRNEFVLHYQPKMHLASGRTTGVEALIRWNRPGHGLVPPLDFIPILEETGLIVPVGAWVIRAACKQIAEWKRTGVGSISISVNLSPRQFSRDGNDAEIAKAILESGVDPQLLEFEIEAARGIRENNIDPALFEFELTEGVLMSHAEKSVAILRRLKALGIRISVDDFGTGYSSLAYLKRFPIDTLKIDRAFIRDVTTNTDDAAITTAIIGMAQSLKLKVVAEGVETSEQLEFLRASGCDEIQGYYLSRPLPAAEVSRLLYSGEILPTPA